MNESVGHDAGVVVVIAVEVVMDCLIVLLLVVGVETRGKAVLLVVGTEVKEEGEKEEVVLAGCWVTIGAEVVLGLVVDW